LLSISLLFPDLIIQPAILCCYIATQPVSLSESWLTGFSWKEASIFNSCEMAVLERQRKLQMTYFIIYCLLAGVARIAEGNN